MTSFVSLFAHAFDRLHPYSLASLFPYIPHLLPAPSPYHNSSSAASNHCATSQTRAFMTADDLPGQPLSTLACSVQPICYSPPLSSYLFGSYPLPIMLMLVR